MFVPTQCERSAGFMAFLFLPPLLVGASALTVLGVCSRSIFVHKCFFLLASPRTRMLLHYSWIDLVLARSMCSSSLFRSMCSSSPPAWIGAPSDGVSFLMCLSFPCSGFDLQRWVRWRTLDGIAGLQQGGRGRPRRGTGRSATNVVSPGRTFVFCSPLSLSLNKIFTGFSLAMRIAALPPMRHQNTVKEPSAKNSVDVTPPAHNHEDVAPPAHNTEHGALPIIQGHGLVHAAPLPLLPPKLPGPSEHPAPLHRWVSIDVPVASLYYPTQQQNFHPQWLAANIPYYPTSPVEMQRNFHRQWMSSSSSVPYYPELPVQMQWNLNQHWMSATSHTPMGHLPPTRRTCQRTLCMHP